MKTNEQILNYWKNQELKHIIPPNDHDTFPEGFNVWNELKFLLPYNESICEVGCGYGRLSKAFPVDSYFGVDINPHAISEAQKRNPNYTFNTIEPGQYPITKNKLIYTVLLHIPDSEIENTIKRLCETTEKHIVIAEVMGEDWRRDGDPPVFNREISTYVDLFSKYGFVLKETKKKLYTRYKDAPMKDKNMTFLKFIHKDYDLKAKLDILVINCHQLDYTKQTVQDLLRQSDNYRLVLVDQESHDQETQEYMDSLCKHYDWITCIKNKNNVPINYIWNWFVQKMDGPYCCILNNDVRVPSNFVRDIITTFESDSTISLVVHPTNHPDYNIANLEQTKYEIVNDHFMQGWDFSVRKSSYPIIPKQLKFFGGDGWIFEKIYQDSTKNIAYALSSPIIHYERRTQSGVNRAIMSKEDVVRHYYGNMNMPLIQNHKKYYIPYDDKTTPAEIIEQTGVKTTGFLNNP